jgi:AraC-like DNA-binding protein
MHSNFSEKRAILLAVYTRLAEPDYHVSTLSTQLFLSERSTHRLVRKCFSCSPSQLIREVRLRRARYLIRTGQASTVSGLASQVGFLHAGHFSKLYQKRFGTRPYQDIRFGFPERNPTDPSTKTTDP